MPKLPAISLLFISFQCLFVAPSPTDYSIRDPRMAGILDRHADSIFRAVGLVRGLIPASLQAVSIGPFAAKKVGQSVPARETTLVDSSLGMVAAVTACMRLDFPEPSTKVDCVLRGLVPLVAQAGSEVVGLRSNGRAVLAAELLLI